MTVICWYDHWCAPSDDLTNRQPAAEKDEGRSGKPDALKGACPVWSGGKAERPNLSLPEREQEGRGETFTVSSKLGAIAHPGVNERNASSPWERLVLNSLKREENRVTSDSYGGIASEQAPGGRRRTPV
jgi:hypothetical protein